jgi:hypothetical protein
MSCAAMIIAQNILRGANLNGSTTNVVGKYLYGTLCCVTKILCITRSYRFELSVKVTLVQMNCKSMYEPYYLLC